MNISQPVSSALESVEFAFLSSDEIRSISVKRIENDATFDSLLNPVPGGLYDTALGSWGDSPCSTCNLVQSSCPGHPGHIELPVHVYNPVFMDQTYRLLRAQCVYCSGFKMASQSLHLIICKLKLLQYGLVREALHVEAIGMDLCGFGADNWPDQENLSLEATEQGKEDVSIIRARDKYVGRVIRHHHHHRLVASSGDVVDTAKHEGASEMRRAVIKDFLATVTLVRKCGNCSAVSPAYRKDRFVKIFEKVLSNKAKNENSKQNLKAADAITTKISRQMRRGGNGYGGGNEDELDEGVADVDAFPPEQERGEAEGAAAAGAIAHGSGGGDGDQRYLPTPEVHARLQRLFEREQELLQLLYNARPSRRGESNRVTADIFFLKTLLVPPNRYRPEARTGDSQISEAQQNSLYKKIMQHSIRIAQVSRALKDPGARADPEADPAVEPVQNANIDTLYQACADLQGAVNALVDKTKNPAQGRAAQRNEDGIKQKLEKKEGLFRMNMMGKRVNYAGRSVISPDPNLETNEIGVPVVFARKLTYPEPVTSHNYRDLQQAVLNGPSLWPGASAVQDESGKIVNLRGKSMEERMTIANQLLTPTSSGGGGGGAAACTNKKVFRHLTNGDVVLMNRQPSLHRPSIMGHRVRVLPGEKTLRMHYANCNAYNADFDGDEMNMHFPQNEMARIEALQVADTDHQYISTTQGAPLRGLIQDHISVAVDLCSRDTMLSRDSYHQLVYGALRPESGHLIAGDRILTVPAAILRPVRRWTGKQVITTILKNLTPAGAAGLWMSADTKISAAEWGSAVSEEGVVRFQDGEFVTGILDKSHIGPSPGGLVHAVHEVYGPNIAGRLLSSLGRLLTKYLNMRAFSCGMDDLRLTAEGEKRRKALLGTGAQIGRTIAANYVSLDTVGRGRQGKETDDELAVRLEEVMRDDGKQEGLDRLMNGACDMIKDEVNKGLMPATLAKKFPRNRMQTMTLSGAKGTRVNATLISCSLGQQVLEGRRVPLMVSGKSLPCFEPFETDARAGGFVANRFLTGIRPQEYYFHHMTGREGLIDTAVKTSRSGYLQRCLIKGMEGLTVTYDSTVRDSDGSLVQFLYGEDGLDVTRQRYLNDFRFTLLNREAAQQQLRLGPDAFAGLARRQAEVRKHMRMAVKYARAGNARGPDPVSSLVNPARHAGATSERFFEAMTEYIRLNPDGLVGGGDVNYRKCSTLGKEPASKRFAETLFEIKYIRSLVEPGEAVGIVAGQSVGEPSTQMTLNTFHLAGHSGKNVTLGIPRLREILMTARKTISTPTMTLYLNRDVSPEAAERFAKSIGILPMSNILDEASVRERTGRAGGGRLQKIYDIRLDFFPAAEYAAMYGITAGDVMRSVEVSLLPRLRNLIAREIKKRKASQGATAAAPEIGVRAAAVEAAPSHRVDLDDGGGGGPDDEGGAGADEEDDDSDGDGDATNAKNKAKRSEATSYGPNDDDDDAIQNEMQQDADLSGDEDEFEDEGFGGSPPPASGRRGRGGRSGDGAEEEEAEEEDDEEGPGERGVPHAWGGLREERLVNTIAPMTQFSCDEQGGQWCRFTLEYETSTPKILMLNLVQDAIRKTVVQQIAGVRTCTYVPAQDRTAAKPEDAYISAEGINLVEMHKFAGMIDVTRIRTNDIYAVLTTYGVEACRLAIVSELVNVFSSHGITVDRRHLNLIGDFMTRNGAFTPFNRIGLRGNASPFTKMSFETTLAFLKDATLDGDWDELLTPSSRLVTGGLGKVGTGSFDVLTRLPTMWGGETGASGMSS